MAAAERAVRTKPTQPESPVNEFYPPPALSRFSAADVMQNSRRSVSPYPSDPLPGNPQAADQSPFGRAIPPALAAEFDPATYAATTSSTPRTSSSSSRTAQSGMQRQQSPPLPTIHSERESVLVQDTGSITPTAQVVAMGGNEVPCSQLPMQRGMRRVRRSSGIEEAPSQGMQPQSKGKKSLSSCLRSIGQKIKRSLLGSGQ